MKRKQDLLMYILAFAGVFVLSLDFWSWHDTNRPNVFGLPSWIYYYILIQIIFVILLMLFTVTYWNQKDQDDGVG